MLKSSVYAPLALVILLAGCSGSGPAAAPGPELVPDFLLEDVNDTSPTFGVMVSPRDERGKISAWYFGSAT